MRRPTSSSTASAVCRALVPAAASSNANSKLRPMAAATLSVPRAPALSRSRRAAITSRTRRGSGSGPPAVRSWSSSVCRVSRICSGLPSLAARGVHRVDRWWPWRCRSRASACTSAVVSGSVSPPSAIFTSRSSLSAPIMRRERMAGLEILFAHGTQEKHGPVGQPPAQEGQQPDAQVVRPVQILEDDQQRRALGDRPEQRGHRLEESNVLVGPSTGAPPGAPSSGNNRESSPRADAASVVLPWPTSPPSRIASTHGPNGRCSPSYDRPSSTAPPRRARPAPLPR